MKAKETVGWTALAVAVVAMFAGAAQHRQRVDPAPEKLDAMLIEGAEDGVKRELKDPGSAVFTDVRILGDGKDRRVCGLVNAKNSFGGYAGNKRFVTFYGGVAFIGDDLPPKEIWDREQHPCDVA